MIGALGLTAAIFVRPPPAPGKAPAGGSQVSVITPPLPAPEKAPPSPAPAPLVPGGGRIEAPPELPGRGILVFVIDDAGNNLKDLEAFLRFPGPLTLAVLPGLANSAEAARRIRAAGKELILHQPMEAVGGQDPGPGAVYTGMSREEIRAAVKRNLDEIGPVAGMNNHQGSKITVNAEVMETVLALCREEGIYFLDSRTTADTVVPVVAERMEIAIGERDVFLDNIPERASMIRYVEDGVERAEQRGSAVMIGHVWSSELIDVLETLYPDLIARGYSLSTLSRLLMEKSQ
ncbi:MAG: divergent polysaccharide deacetylase family protein [Treponema sp.]|nr:divergent polysaccharide deacetylase family protein [Treponema sp.]